MFQLRRKEVRPSPQAARRRAPALLAACALAIACIITQPARSDEVAAYLEQHGLTHLLATHLEGQLASATGEQKETVLRRLADLYAQLLEREDDPARRIAIERRSRLLLDQAPTGSADDLRLALLRASYRTAEKIAENHRLRLARPDEVQTAQRTFAEIAPQLRSLADQTAQSIATLERRLSRASGTDAIAINESLDRARGQRGQAAFLAAWSMYYDDWLRDDRSINNVRAAEALFAELMGAETATPNPEDISNDLRSEEAIARSILGMALCKSLSSSPATAVAWVLLLTAPNAYEPLRLQAPVWELAIRLEHGEFRDALDVLDEARATLPEVPLAWLRLCAVHALESGDRDRFAREMLSFAVTELAARGELQQVLDLATRYGVTALGDTGFALKYVQGVIGYQEARAKHASEQPTTDPSVTDMYASAEAKLAEAIAESDADRFPTAAAACRRLIAWCLYFRSEFLEARRQFESAATVLSGEEAAEALWMAIVSLDTVAEAGRSADVSLALEQLMDRYIAQYPSDARTAKLLLKRSMRRSEPSPEAVAELLSIPPDNEVFAAAQERAADMLYQLFRSARSGERLGYAAQFLGIAVPLISQPPRGVDTESADTATPLDRFIIRCRQVLEVSLTEDVERAGAARAAFDALDSATALYPQAISINADEIDCRRVQERLLADDVASATRTADSLWNRANDSIWSRMAVRAVFRHAHRIWKSESGSPAEQRAALDRVAQYGGRVLHEFKDDPNALERAGALGYFAAVAQATFEQWQRNGDRETAEKSLFLFDALIAKHPDNAAFLRAAALLSEACDQPTKALDYWRTIVSGVSIGSPTWYEAKFHQIQMLAEIDPPLAREVLNQHKALNPEYGPDPWGAKIKGLDELVPENPAPPAPAVEGTP